MTAMALHVSLGVQAAVKEGCDPSEASCSASCRSLSLSAVVIVPHLGCTAALSG